MDAHSDKLTRSAFWCGVLKGDARPVAPGCAVRTVRGTFSAARNVAAEDVHGDALREPAQRVGRLRA